MTDKNKLTATGVVRLNLVGGLPEDFAINECKSTEVCKLADAPVGVNFSYSFVASTAGITWKFTGLPGWLTSGTTDSAGVLNGVPKVANCGSHEFLVTATKGTASVTRRFKIDVVTGTPPQGGDPAEYRCPSR